MSERIVIRGWMLALPLLVVVLTLEAVWFDQRVREASAAIQTPLPVLGAIRSFHLVDTSGVAMSRSDLKGYFWIVNLAHTRSKVQTPLLLQTMQELQRIIPPSWPVRFLTVAVEADDDTPEAFDRLRQTIYVDRDRWRFMTGDSAPLREFVLRSLRLGIDRYPEEAEDPLGHSARLVLVDPDGNLRAYYDGTAENPFPAILEDLQTLVSARAE